MDGEPRVLVTPASPELTTTVTPAATASSSAIRVASCAVSGNWLAPKDSFSTLTPLADGVVDGLDEVRLVVSCSFEKTSRPMTLAPGAAPVTVMLHPAGSGCRRVLELAEVVHRVPLRRDRARVQERLEVERRRSAGCRRLKFTLRHDRRAGRGARRGVLRVPLEVGDRRVDAARDVGDLDAGAVDAERRAPGALITDSASGSFSGDRGVAGQIPGPAVGVGLELVGVSGEKSCCASEGICDFGAGMSESGKTALTAEFCFSACSCAELTDATTNGNALPEATCFAPCERSVRASGPTSVLDDPGPGGRTSA